MISRILIILAAIIVVAGISILMLFRPISATHPALQSGLPDLVPLRQYYANSASKWRYRLSPDGKHIAWLESKYLKPALWVRSLEGKDTNIFHTEDMVRWYAWSADSRYLLYQADRDGWENDVIVSIDVTQSGAEPRTYSFGKKAKSWIHSIPAEAGNDILIGHNGRDPTKFDLYRLNLDSGETNPMHLIAEQGVTWSVNRKGEIYARAIYKKPDDWRVQIREGETWREIARGGLEESFRVISEPNEDGRLLAISDLGRDKRALIKFDPVTGTEELLFEDNAVDLSWVELDPRDGRALSVVSYPSYQARTYYDDGYEKMMSAVPRPDSTSLHRVSSTHDMSMMIVEVEHSTLGWSKHLIDRSTGDVNTIETPPIAELADSLSPMEPVTFQAQDGLTLHATLTKPKGVNGPGPMVIIIHGGPVHRSKWGFSSLHSWMANRGYAVLDVNYRASAGFGRKFREAAAGEISRKMHQDIIDARQWAVDQGIADPDKVAVFGGSFGGLKVLTALTQTPELFAVGIDINGISDISTMLHEVPVYWTGWPHWYLKYIGDPEDPAQLADIRDRSPIYHADKVKAPLLIIQGSNDVRVIRDQADRMVEALQANGKNVDYMLLEGAGHQSRNWGWKTRIVAFRRMERFLARHLGGRADGFDYAVLGAHILR